MYCGCQPGPTRVALHTGRMVEKPERQLYIHWTTCYDYRGVVDYRRVFLQKNVKYEVKTIEFLQNNEKTLTKLSAMSFE